MKKSDFTILSNKKIADRTYEMKLSAPEGTGVTNAGQFINIKIDGFFLRRPISICDWTDGEPVSYTHLQSCFGIVRR